MKRALVWIVPYVAAVLSSGYLIFFAGGCATSTVPYVSDRLTGELSKYWASRGGSTTKSLDIYNPTDQTVEVLVHCNGDLYEGEPFKWFTLPPHGEEHGLISVMNRDAVGSSCDVVKWNTVNVSN